ncbi:oxidoreductase [Pseudonocardia bannensis]|uniref:Oxidoreductase n=1 Tax=Pseudonocardia bannensis TaxID=630973 RepID=A0A848DDM2_9PSEU|nr:oxidoreductase [Pseudonocardia bannensis]NMH90673.1 oxidoreductase [Pseudonocardia bannensis]
MPPSRVSDPLAPLLDLPGVADAVARARDAVVAVHNHPVNRRGWPATAAEASLRAARASAALDGAPLTPSTEELVTDPVLAGAVRAAEESSRLLGVWRGAPLQALARLHMVAAADLVPGDRHGTDLGRPRTDEEVSARLSLLADLVTGGTAVPAPVLVAVVHGELLTLAPFGTANGVVARAAARLAAVAAGLDPKGLAVPEVGHLRRADEYRTAAAGFASGTAEGVTTWLLHCCAQWESGAREGTSIAESRS